MSVFCQPINYSSLYNTYHDNSDIESKRELISVQGGNHNFKLGSKNVQSLTPFDEYNGNKKKTQRDHRIFVKNLYDMSAKIDSNILQNYLMIVKLTILNIFYEIGGIKKMKSMV